MMTGRQHGSSRKHLEITLITDGDNNRIRYHSPPHMYYRRHSHRVSLFKWNNLFFSITLSESETKTTIMSTPTTPVISVTDINDETTVIEQPREESTSPLPIPPPQSK